ncbi:MAG: DUF3427 domain-containing protein, partial [Planctomycetota bacterium]
NRTSQASPHGNMIKNHASLGLHVHLFVRDRKRRGKSAAPFTYCGELDFESWDGEKPITVRWRLTHALSDELLERFQP